MTISTMTKFAARHIMTDLYYKIQSGTIPLKAHQVYVDLKEFYGPSCLPNEVLITDCGLSVRLTKSLEKYGIVTLGQLRVVRKEDYQNIPNLGNKSKKELEAFAESVL